MADNRKRQSQGFTLVEISVVLVIIGLIVGSVLASKDMYQASLARAQITQIQKYNAAVNQFRNQFTQLPGDIKASLATKFGFAYPSGRSGGTGQGDGNGLIEGYIFSGHSPYFGVQEGEPLWFWQDLTVNGGNLIDGTFNTTGTADLGVNYYPSWSGVGLSLNLLLPQAAIGNNNWVDIYSDATYNYFSVSSINNIDGSGVLWGSGGSNNLYPGITVAQASSIDTKIDDGLPQTGMVTAKYENWMLSSNNGGSGTFYGAQMAAGKGGVGPTGTTATQGTTSTCYDNNNSNGATQHYSMEINKGIIANCGLSFQFQ